LKKFIKNVKKAFETKNFSLRTGFELITPSTRYPLERDFWMMKKKIELAEGPKYMEKFQFVETFRGDWQENWNYRSY